jgi:ornithine cyclodeaminase/alanine dehydrogenase-like protein (mu-crystallin family)
MLILNNTEIVQLMDMRSCVDVLEQAARALASDDAVARPATSVVMPRMGPDGLHGAYKLENRDGIARPVKMAALRLMSDNHVFERLPNGMLKRHKLPTAKGNRYVGLVLLFDTETAELVAILPDGEIQRCRVAGTGALVSKYVARADAHILGVLGSGRQAETAVLANCLVRDIKQVRVFSPNREHRESFCARMREQVHCSVEPAQTGEKAVRGSDLVVAVTEEIRSVLDKSWLEPGMHVNLSKFYELDEEGWKRCDLIIEGARPQQNDPSYWSRQIHNNRHIMGGRDLVEGTWLARRPGAFAGPRARHVALPDLVLGQQPGRQRDEEISCFYISNPSGAQIAYMGALILERAKSRGLGREIPSEWFSQQEKD